MVSFYLFLWWHQYFDWYGPSFELDISRGLRRDENSPDYIRSLLEQVLSKSSDEA